MSKRLETWHFGSYVNNKMTQKTPTNIITENLREIPLHLHELSKFCTLLWEETNFKNFVVLPHKRIAKKCYFKGIGNWLMTASQLECVTMNKNNYSDISAISFCEPVSGYLESEASHKEDHMTALTRFLFIWNAMEDCFRFVKPKYLTLVNTRKLPIKRKKRTNAEIAIHILDLCENKILHSQELKQHINEFISLYQIYLIEYKKITGIKKEFSSLPIGLKRIKELRNDIAHGLFPLIENPSYSHCLIEHTISLVELLDKATRLCAIYTYRYLYSIFIMIFLKVYA